MATIQAAARIDVTLKDAALAGAFVALAGLTLVFGLRASRAEMERDQLRAHDRALSERIERLDASLQAIRSYANTAEALASPESAVNARFPDPTARRFQASFVMDLPALAADALPLGERQSDVDRLMHRLAQIDRAQQGAEVLVRRMSGLADLLKANKALVRAIPSIMPVEGGRVSSEFGVRLSPTEGRRHMHAGIDIAADPGTGIMAPADATVSFVGEFEDMGRTVVLDHGNGILTRFGHTERWLVREGQKVKRGHEIARVGNTGRSTGPHVHYEIWVNNNPVNPREFLFDLSERPGFGTSSAAARPEQLWEPSLQVARAP